MAKHENPQRPAEVYYPAGHPRHRPQEPQTPGDVQQPADRASAPPSPDLGDIIRGITDLAGELHEAFFNVPGAADDSGRVNPEQFDASMQQAFIACGNALDYAIRLVTEKGRALRILNLRRELAEEMRAAGISGEPFDQVSG